MIAWASEQGTVWLDYAKLPSTLYIDGIVQERRNSSVLAMEFGLSCTNYHTCVDWGVSLYWMKPNYIFDN